MHNYCFIHVVEFWPSFKGGQMALTLLHPPSGLNELLIMWFLLGNHSFIMVIWHFPGSNVEEKINQNQFNNMRHFIYLCLIENEFCDSNLQDRKWAGQQWRVNDCGWLSVQILLRKHQDRLIFFPFYGIMEDQWHSKNNCWDSRRKKRKTQGYNRIWHLAVCRWAQ